MTYRSDEVQQAWDDAVSDFAESYFVEAAHAEALAEDADRTGGSSFDLTRDHRTLNFRIATTERVTSYRGTEFVPNHCDSIVEHGKVITLNLSKLDENGWGIDDPAGPDGAELNASFSPERADLPKVAQDALDAIKWAIR